jgi:hypothetical protein
MATTKNHQLHSYVPAVGEASHTTNERELQVGGRNDDSAVPREVLDVKAAVPSCSADETN